MAIDHSNEFLSNTDSVSCFSLYSVGVTNKILKATVNPGKILFDWRLSDIGFLEVPIHVVSSILVSESSLKKFSFSPFPGGDIHIHQSIQFYIQVFS